MLTRSPVYATRGAVATSQPLATEAGVHVLRDGGNAVDAAIAAAGVLALTEPCSCGLGGDAFALVYRARTEQVLALNGSGRAPAALSLARLAADGFGAGPPAHHAHNVTVPGAVAALCELSERCGTIPLGDALAPAIALAEDGFAVAPITAYFWDHGAELLRRAVGGHQLLIEGRAPRAGELIRNRALADVMRRLASGGRRAFYEGELAEHLAATVQAAGGALSAADLRGHRCTWEQPISATYRGVRVWECPPSGQGLAALLALRILGHLEVVEHAPLGAARLHAVIEALRCAFADTRAYVADPAVSPAPVAALLADAYTAARAAAIDPARAQPDVKAGSPVAGSDTVYLAAVDGEGNACSLIFSNYMGFGTGIVPEGLGFALQNRGAGFAFTAEHPNCVAPGKRPYHTIIPAMSTRADGSLHACFGVMGGFMQPQGHVQVVLGLVADDLDPQAALERPRVCLPGGEASGGVAIEDGIDPDVTAELARRGHAVTPVSGMARAVFGRGQIITREPKTGVLCAGSDPRADGCAMGY